MNLIELAKTEVWWLAARDRVKEVIDGPDFDIDRIILGTLKSGGKVPEALAHDFPLLKESTIANQVESAIASTSTARLPRAW